MYLFITYLLQYNNC